MSGKLSIEVSIADQVVLVKLKGVIDEEAALARIQHSGRPEIQFDFDGVKGINSMGVREWVCFLDSLPKGTRQIYVNCHAQIAEQIALVGGFVRAGTEVRSCYLPYYCEGSDVEKEIPFLLKESVNGMPVVKCDKCQAPMEFEADDSVLQTLFKRAK